MLFQANIWADLTRHMFYYAIFKTVSPSTVGIKKNRQKMVHRNVSFLKIMVLWSLTGQMRFKSLSQFDVITAVFKEQLWSLCRAFTGLSKETPKTGIRCSFCYRCGKYRPVESLLTFCLTCKRPCNSSPKNENYLNISSPPSNPRCIWLSFFSRREMKFLRNFSPSKANEWSSA